MEALCVHRNNVDSLGYKKNVHTEEKTNGLKHLKTIASFQTKEQKTDKTNILKMQALVSVGYRFDWQSHNYLKKREGGYLI